MRPVQLLFPVCTLLAFASKLNIFSDSLSHLKELCRIGDSKGVEQVLASKEEKPSKQALQESFKTALKAGNHQICRSLASNLPRKWVLRQIFKNKDFKSLKMILGEGSTNLSTVDEMFMDHCLKNSSGCEGVREELKLFLKISSLDTALISEILVGIINLELFNVDLFRLLLADGRFETLFKSPLFLDYTIEALRLLCCKGNYQYDLFLVELMSSPVWSQITVEWGGEAHVYFMSNLCKYGALHSLRHYLLNNKVKEQQLLLCVSESLVTPLAFSPFVMSVLLDLPRSQPESFLTGLQSIVVNRKQILGSHPIFLENYMVLLFSLFRVKGLSHLAEGHPLQSLHQELRDYLIVTRLKYMQVDGMGGVPSDITRLIASAYLSISDFL